MTIATTEDAAPAKKGPSFVLQLAVLLVLTGLAIGGGWFAGYYLKKGTAPQADIGQMAVIVAEPEPAEGAEDGGNETDLDGPAPASEGEDGKPRPRLVTIDPITTNLASPGNIWVRMEVAMVFDDRPPPELLRTIHQDILAYMRTVTLHQVQGASGFQHLKTDLEERIRIRSDGHASQLLIRTLLFE